MKIRRTEFDHYGDQRWALHENEDWMVASWNGFSLTDNKFCSCSFGFEISFASEMNFEIQPELFQTGKV